MTMTKGDAAYVQTIARWLTGDPNVGADTAYWALGKLAGRARKVAGAGVGEGTVQDFYDDHNPELSWRDRPVCHACNGLRYLPEDGPDYECDACAGTGSSAPQVIAASRAATQAAMARTRGRTDG